MLLSVMVWLPLMLSGCAKNETLLAEPTRIIKPEPRAVDLRIAECDHLMNLSDAEYLDNPLYWLRIMDCSDRLAPVRARELARNMLPVRWDEAFKQGILYANADPSSIERRRSIERLNNYRIDFPMTVRPLIQLWRDDQWMQISLSEERVRYQRLQESTDAQMDMLRRSHERLAIKLEETSRKLENLTDIERQLSSRKQFQGDMQDRNGNKGHAVLGESPKVNGDNGKLPEGSDQDNDHATVAPSAASGASAIKNESVEKAMPATPAPAAPAIASPSAAPMKEVKPNDNTSNRSPSAG